MQKPIAIAKAQKGDTAVTESLVLRQAADAFGTWVNDENKLWNTEGAAKGPRKRAVPFSEPGDDSEGDTDSFFEDSDDDAGSASPDEAASRILMRREHGRRSRPRTETAA